MIFLGKIEGPFGVNGLLTLQSYCEPKESIKTYSPIYIEGKKDALDLKFVGNHNNKFTVQIDKINTRESANSFRGRHVYVKRDTLKNLMEEEFYYVDLLECTIFSECMKKIGPVINVENYGAGDIIEFINKETNKKIMIPLNRKFVKAISIKQKVVVLYDFAVSS